MASREAFCLTASSLEEEGLERPAGESRFGNLRIARVDEPDAGLDWEVLIGGRVVAVAGA